MSLFSRNSFWFSMFLLLSTTASAGPGTNTLPKSSKDSAIQKVVDCSGTSQLQMTCPTYCEKCRGYNPHTEFRGHNLYRDCLEACSWRTKPLEAAFEKNCEGCARDFKVRMAEKLNACEDGAGAYQSVIKTDLRHKISLSGAQELCAGYRQEKKSLVVPVEASGPARKTPAEATAEH